MKRVAIFGNAGAGKSTLAKRLAELTRLPLYALDLIQFRAGGADISEDDFQQAHAALLSTDEWIIDGFGSVDTTWKRLAAADTLIFIDLAPAVNYWWITKRLIESVFVKPEGWPDDSPILASSLKSYRVVWRCHRLLIPRYRHIVEQMATFKRVHHLTSPRDMKTFIEALEREYAEIP